MARTDWEVIVGKQGRQELLRFQLEMINVRVGLGLSHRDLRNALKKLGNNSNPETGSLYWQMANVQDWCEVLGGKLALTYHNLPDPDPDELDGVVQGLRAMFKEAEFDRWYAVRYLAQARIASKINTVEMGKRIGLTSSGVGHWEQDTANPMIPSLMRHAQALGGFVTLGYEAADLVQGPNGRKK
jgi:DNA-binding XRE family transcriptional regulator